LKPLTIAEQEMMIMALHDEIRRNKNARYDHKLHAILLVALGFTCPEVSRMMGDSVRTIENWVNKFEKIGFSALGERSRPGRPSRLSDEQLYRIKLALARSPREYDIDANIWDGKTLSWFILNEFGIVLEVRQCQRLFRKLDFTYRKPRPIIAGTDEEIKEIFKKTRRAAQ
jgi:transposase